jgi:hypothetical protein
VTEFILRSELPKDPNGETSGPSRASPELDAAEIEGQYFDSTSGLTFLHRAYKRFSTQRGQIFPNVLTGSEKSQPLMSAGDMPLMSDGSGSIPLLEKSVLLDLVAFYFDVCVVTYRIFHRQTVEGWMETLLSSSEPNRHLAQRLGNARTAIILAIMAIVTFRREKIQSSNPGLVDTVRLQQSGQADTGALSSPDFPDEPRVVRFRHHLSDNFSAWASSPVQVQDKGFIQSLRWDLYHRTK